MRVVDAHHLVNVCSVTALVTGAAEVACKTTCGSISFENLSTKELFKPLDFTGYSDSTRYMETNCACF